jgi:hypothetical protein
VDPIHKGTTAYHGPEQVVGFKQKGMTAVLTKMDLFRTIGWVPAEFVTFLGVEHRAELFSFQGVFRVSVNFFQFLLRLLQVFNCTNTLGVLALNGFCS